MFFAALSTLTALSIQLPAQDLNAFDALVLEAPITFKNTFTTTRKTTTRTVATGRIDTYATVITPVTQLQFIDDLRASEIVPGTTSVGWSLVAVRPAPADLVYIDSTFDLYAVNPSYPAVPPATSPGARIFVSSLKFRSLGMESVRQYTERTQGQYVISSTGVVTNFSEYSYLPTITIPGITGAPATTVKILDNNCSGNSSIGFAAREVSNVFFYAITSLRVSARGPFVGQEIPANTNKGGLATIDITIGTPKLVLQSLYPEVDVFRVDK
jgi:hypothetical protein